MCCYQLLHLRHEITFMNISNDNEFNEYSVIRCYSLLFVSQVHQMSPHLHLFSQ
jgi:hypothetical protein